MLSVQPRSSHTAGAVSNDDLVTSIAQDILANLPAPLAREDASIARDPFAPLPTGGYPPAVVLVGMVRIDCCGKGKTSAGQSQPMTSSKRH